MSKKKLILIAAVAVMLVSATFAVGDNIYFSGEGTGTCGELHSWGTWTGHIAPAIEPYFVGTWSAGGSTGTIFGAATYNETYDYYFVSNGYWDCDQNELDGHWTGYFKVTADTAYGLWWDTDQTCNGSYWGNLVE